MTNTPPRTRLEEIEARLSAATPGPWFVAEQPFDDRSTAVYGDNTAQVACDPHGARFIADCDVTMEWTEGEPDQSVFDRANAELIAHAPTDLAWLVERVRELEGALEFECGNRCAEQNPCNAKETLKRGRGVRDV